MRKITFYIAKTILGTLLLTLFLLVGLEFIFSFVNELRLVGAGDYTFYKALLHVFFSLPSLSIQLFPMAALVGTLLGLGLLATRSELIIIQTAGLSKGDIVAIVLKLSCVFVFITWVAGEWWIPMLDNWATTQKAVALSKGQALNTAHGVWMKEGEDFIHIKRVRSDYLEGVACYSFDKDLQMKKIAYASYADYQSDHWVLHDIVETLFSDQSVTKAHIKERTWRSALDPKVLHVVGVKEPEDFSLKALWNIIQFRKQNELDSAAYQLIFWQRLIRPLAVLIMMFLAIPFLFGPLRQVSMGVRTLVGVLVGFSFFTINQLMGPLTLVYHIPAFIGAILPCVLFLMLGLYLLKKYN